MLICGDFFPETSPREVCGVNVIAEAWHTLSARMYKHTSSGYEGVVCRSVREEEGRRGGTGGGCAEPRGSRNNGVLNFSYRNTCKPCVCVCVCVCVA